MKSKYRYLSFLSLMARGIIFIFIITMISFPFDQASSNQEVNGEIQVEEELSDQMAIDSSTGYMIYFRDHSDLSAAYSKNWEERGKLVLKTLQSSAEKAQKEVRAYLDEQGVPYQSFWVDNIIVVEKSNLGVFNNLMSFPEIESLRARRTMSVIEPERLPVINSILSVEPNITHVGAPDVWALGYTGENIVVANIDTGVRYTHQALLPHYRGNLGGGSYNHNYNWWDPYGDYPSYPGDTNGHGTHTMGTMVGDDNSSNKIGMAPGAEWIACRACSTTECSDAALLSCAQFMVAPWNLSGADADSSKRPNVINNSWGDCETSYNNWYQGVVNNWQAAGIYPVFSNGNASNCGYSTPPGLNTVGNPARYGNVTGVGSSGQTDGQYATHSNWGPTDNPDTINPRGYPYLKPQVIAPGVNIRSSVNTGDAAYEGGWSGTSMSAPHVTGLIALMWSAAPCLIGDYANSETIIEQTATAIPYASGGTPAPGPGNVPNYATGWGEIDALAATQAAISYCSDSSLIGKVTRSSDNEPIANALISAASTITNSTYTDFKGDYSLSLYSGLYTVTASSYGYFTEVIPDVNVANTTTLNIALDPVSTSTVSGTVTDETTDWPIYAKITIDGYPGDPIWTNPINGQYSVELAQGTDYTFTVEDFWASYSTVFTSTGVLSSDMLLNFELNIDGTICTAPGYTKPNLLKEEFNSGLLPSGWTLVDNAGTGAVWTFDDPGSRGNLTGGKGQFADANSDAAGSIAMNTELRTPLLDFSGFSELALEFKYDWNEFSGNEIADVDISVNGNAGPWTNLWRNSSGDDRGPKTATIDLSAYGGQNNVMLRFHYYGAFWDWWWQVDDVIITSSCDLLSGGLVVGNVYDGNTSQPINDAELSNDSLITVVSLPTLDDSMVDDGFFTIFSLAGTHTFTATKTGYQPDIASLSVILSNTVEHDFTLFVPPVSNFSASPTFGKAPLTVIFTDSSTGIITSWLWDFGDGQTSALQNPSHQYSLKGVYSVSLLVAGPGGSDLELKSGYIRVNFLSYLPILVRNALALTGFQPNFFTQTP